MYKTTEHKREYARKHSRQYRIMHRDQCLQYNSTYKKKHKLDIASKSRKYQQKRFGYYRELQLKRKYNMSLRAYEVLFNKQDGTCAICKHSPTKRILQVDHDHKTGIIRGLLCDRCNTGLGAFKDNPSYMLRAIHYLDRVRSMTE